MAKQAKNKKTDYYRFGQLGVLYPVYGAESNIGVRYARYVDARRAQVARAIVDPDNAPRQKDLAKIHGVSQQTISTDLKAIRKLWRESQVRDWNKERQARLDQIATIKLEALEAWQKSKAEAETLTEEEDSDGNIKTTKRKKGQTGNARYLDVLLRCIDREVELLQLIPKESQVLEIKTTQDKLLDLIADGKVTFADLAGELGEDAANALVGKAKLLNS